MTILIWILAFILAITIHEAAHAWMADHLGDPTARLLGRLTLNPIKHIDPYGTILVPFFLTLIHSPFIFGWAKPVPIDPYNLKNPRRDSALISLAGPISNFGMASMSALIAQLIFRISSLVIYTSIFDPQSLALQITSGSVTYPEALLATFFGSIILLSITLGIFNLIPIHPLDGGKILLALVPNKLSRQLDIFLTQYGFVLLFILIVPIINGVSIINYLINPTIMFVLNLFLPGASFI